MPVAHEMFKLCCMKTLDLSDICQVHTTYSIQEVNLQYLYL